MPSVSKAQQRFMGLVHAYKKGEVPASQVSQAVKDAAKSMKKKSTKKFASTKHDDLPDKVREYVVSENPAAAAAAAMVMMKLQNPDTGKKISAITPLRNKDHKLHKKSKGIFQRLKDKFMKKNESVNENSKVYSVDMDAMVNILSIWEKGEGGYTSGNPYMGKKGKAEPFYDSGAGMHVSGGIKDALKALTKRWKKLDVKPNTTAKIFKAYHKLPDNKKKFKNPSFWEKFLEKNGISVVAESVNEDGHTDVASAERKLKLIMKDAMDTLNALRSLSDEDSLPSWWTDKITLAKDYVGKSRDYIMNPAESVNEQSKTIKSIQNLADKNKYGTVSGTRMNGKTAKEIIAIYNHPKIKSLRGKMDKMKSHELVDLTIRLPRMLGIKVESINETPQKVAKLLIKYGNNPKDVKDMVKKHYKKAKKDRSKATPSQLANYISFLSANESVNEVSGVDVAKRVLKNKQYEKGIDLQTANLIVTIDKAYDKNPRLQKKFRALQLPKMKQLIMKYYG